jgi:uncharacterized protein (TIGR03435 family)
MRNRRNLIFSTPAIMALSAVPVLVGLISASRLWAQGRTAQSPTPQWQLDAGDKMAFDAASVKQSKPDASGRGNLSQSGGHVSMTGAPLLSIVAQAYKFTNLSDATNMIFGMPDWAYAKRFDIEAEAPGNPTLDQKRLMLQSLLADRFHLVAHREKRQLPVYAVVLAKPGKLGPQLHPRNNDAECTTAPQPLPGGVSASSSSEAPADAAVALLQQYSCGRAEGGLLSSNDHDRVWAGGRKMDMGSIANSIGGMEATERPIVDQTGLSGLFDFTVEWSHQLQGLSVNPQPDIPGMMSLADALRDQLGLKLKRTTASVDVLVIDHVEEPSPN